MPILPPWGERMSVDDFTPEVVERFIKAVLEDERWIMRDIWADRLGPEKWDVRHGGTQSFKKPGALRKEGAISALRFILRKMEWLKEVKE